MYINKIGSCVPVQSYTNQDLLGYFEKYKPDVFSGLQEFFNKQKPIFNAIGVKKRHTGIDLEKFFATGDIETRMPCSQIIMNSIRKCLGEIRPDSFDYLITMSDTQDYIFPGQSSVMIRDLAEQGMPYKLKHYNLQGMGCSGLVSGLEMAQYILSHDPKAKVMLSIAEVCTYLCDVNKINASTDKGKMYFIQFFLFGEGGASFLLSNDEYGLCRVDKSMRITNKQREHMKVCIVEKGGSVKPDVDMRPEFIIRPELGGIALQYSEELIRSMIDRYRDEDGFDLKGIDKFVIHTGSSALLAKVVEFIGSIGMKVDREFLKSSYHVLENYGNLSIASLPMILSRINETGLPQKGVHCLVLGFGAGFGAGINRIEFV